MSFTPFCSSCCPTGPSAHASSGATVRRPAHAQTGEFPITRWLLILGGQPAEIDTAACLEALRCCNKRWKAFFAGVLPDGHYLCGDVRSLGLGHATHGTDDLSIVLEGLLGMADEARHHARRRRS